MNSFAPGDYVAAVACVHNLFGAIHRGKLYRVAAIMVAGHDCSEHHSHFPGQCPRMGVALHGEPPNFWCVSGFRPVYRPKGDLFDRLMAPVPSVGEPHQWSPIRIIR